MIGVWHPQEPIIQPRALGRWRRFPLQSALHCIAVSSGSDSGSATLPDGGNAAESSSPEPSSSPDEVIDILSSAGAPNQRC